MDEDKPKMKRKKKETSGERKPNWKEYMATVEDIQNFLMDRILLRHNVNTGRVEYRLPSRDYFSTTPSYGHPSFQTEGSSDWQPINDRIVNSLWAELSATKMVRVQDMYRVMYFRRPANGEFGEFMPVSRAMQIVGGNITQKLNVFTLGRAFKDLDFEKVVRNHIRGYIVVQRSPEEIKARQSMLGGNSVTDGTEIF
jgi:hypothetical protein